MFSTKQLFACLQRSTPLNKFLIGYSGGVDSHVLLHALVALRECHPALQLQAVYINHGLSAHADYWQQHCQKNCAELAVQFITKKISVVKKTGESIEALARDARYAAFAELLEADVALLTAHTRDDQAETLLLQLFRGSGPKGLAAMPIVKAFAKSVHARPLLAFTRQELEIYARENHLQWIEDDTNKDLRFDRNYIRQQVLPVIKKRWPSVTKTIARSAEHCVEAVQLIEEFADLDSKNVIIEKKLLVDLLQQLNQARQKNILRRWLYKNIFVIPDEKKLNEIIKSVISASPDATPCVEIEEYEVRRYQNELFVLKKQQNFDQRIIVPWDLSSPLELPADLGTLQVLEVKGQGIKIGIDAQKVTVRFRQGGERIRPSNKKESHALKKLFQQWRIPPWQRERTPLIYFEDTLIAVVGYCVAQGYQASAEEDGWVISQVV